MCELVLVCVHLLILTSPDSVQTGSTALYMASQEGNCEIVKVLLEAKADVNRKNYVSECCSSNGVCGYTGISIVDS